MSIKGAKPKYILYSSTLVSSWPSILEGFVFMNATNHELKIFKKKKKLNLACIGYGYVSPWHYFLNKAIKVYIMVGILSNLKEIENIQEAVWSKRCSIFYQWVGIHRFGYSQGEPETMFLVPGEWFPSPNPPLVSGLVTAFKPTGYIPGVHRPPY